MVYEFRQNLFLLLLRKWKRHPERMSFMKRRGLMVYRPAVPCKEETGTALPLVELSLQLCFVAVLVHYVGIVQLGDEALTEARYVFLPEGGLFLLFLGGKAFCFCFSRKFIYALYFIGCHDDTSIKSWGRLGPFLLYLQKGRKVDIKN